MSGEGIEHETIDTSLPLSPTEFSPKSRAAADRPTSWSEKLSMPGVRPALITNILGGLLYGISIGFLPIMLQFNQYLGDCSRYSSLDACNDLTYTGCVWVPRNDSLGFYENFCGFPDYKNINCTNYTSQGSCAVAEGGDACYWRFHKQKCAHVVGWDSNQQGLLAGMQIIGSMISSATAGFMANRFGRRFSLFISGVVCIVACVFFTSGWAAQESYALLVLGELFVGMAAGGVSVICPMYSGELVKGKMNETIGVFFQLSVTFGIFLAAALGLAIDPRDDVATQQGHHAHLQARFNWMNGLQWAIAVAMLPLAYLVPESPQWLRDLAEHKGGAGASLCEESVPLQETKKLMTESDKKELRESGASASDQKSEPEGCEQKNEGGNDDDDDDHHKQSSSLSDLFRRENALALAVGFVLSLAQQFTSINVNMIYGPMVMSKLGLPPLVGNMIIGTWNFVSCFAPFLLTRKYSARQIFIGCCGFATFACALTGVSVFPGVFEQDSAPQHALGITGIMLFILAFEAGLGPMLYILAQDIFPPHIRSLGTSYTVWCCFTLNLAINWGYPVAQIALSGGLSGNQNQGLGASFMIFAGCGCFSTVFLYFKMPLSNSEKKHAAQIKDSSEFENSSPSPPSSPIQKNSSYSTAAAATTAYTPQQGEEDQDPTSLSTIRGSSAKN